MKKIKVTEELRHVYQHYLNQGGSEITCFPRKKGWTDDDYELYKAAHFASRHRWFTYLDIAQMLRYKSNQAPVMKRLIKEITKGTCGEFTALPADGGIIWTKQPLKK